MTLEERARKIVQDRTPFKVEAGIPVDIVQFPVAHLEKLIVDEMHDLLDEAAHLWGIENTSCSRAKDDHNLNLTQWTLADAEARLATAVYEAALLLERLEDAGKIDGNGHHAAQAVAKAAVKELRHRWKL